MMISFMKRKMLVAEDARMETCAEFAEKQPFYRLKKPKRRQPLYTPRNSITRTDACLIVLHRNLPHKPGTYARNVLRHFDSCTCLARKACCRSGMTWENHMREHKGKYPVPREYLKLICHR